MLSENAETGIETSEEPSFMQQKGEKALSPLPPIHDG
jgi:hypothetical protein